MREGPLFIGPAELDDIRRHADWREVFLALGIRRVKSPGREDDWWALSPFRTETRPSFHMNAHGFHCFSTGLGGGVIELVQRVKEINCYEAGRWLVENGLSHCSGGQRPAAGAAEPAAAPGDAAKGNICGGGTETESGRAENRAIRQDLLPLLDAAHPELQRRGISPATAAYLGCGYLPEGGRSPLAGRLVFQVRGVRPGKDGQAAPAILTHVGRALTEEQEAAAGKWHFYGGFRKTQELYNLDRLLLDDAAVQQAQAAGRFLLVEGCFDVAQLEEAGVLNAGATFGAHLDEGQLPRLRELAAATGVSRFRIWYDRDPAGRHGQEQAVALINADGGLTAEGFDWEATFPSPLRGQLTIPETLADPGDFSGEQLKWLREHGVI
jgi:hypothetical protein